jgi:hypothetical protein
LLVSVGECSFIFIRIGVGDFWPVSLLTLFAYEMQTIIPLGLMIGLIAEEKPITEDVIYHIYRSFWFAYTINGLFN